MTDKEIAGLVLRLFESKGKSYTQVTVKVWVEELKEVDHDSIQYAIKKAIISPDDFPSVGKLLQIIDNAIEDKALALFDKIIKDEIKFDTLPLPVQAHFKKYSLKYIRETGNCSSECLDSFITTFKAIKKQGVQIGNEEKKQIGV